MITRRSFVRTLATVAGTLLLPLDRLVSQPLVSVVQAQAASATDTGGDSPEAFLARAYAGRAHAMTANDSGALDALYGANARLLAHERDRVTFMYGLGSRWDGTILAYEADLPLVELQMSGAVATGRVYERLHVLWIPAPRPESAVRRALRQQYPEKFAATTPRGPRGEIDSYIGTRHEVTLEKGAQGWRLVRDSYEEPPLYGASPDLVPGSWSAVRAGFPSGGALALGPVPAAPQSVATLTTCYSYNWTAAKDYALAHWSSYNSSYCNYNPCGGDCANFVSQCLRAGNQVDDPGGVWRTFNGACGRCGTTSVNAGTDTWANPKMMRDWLLSSGRAVSKSGIDGLGMGDPITYDFEGDGYWDHTAIVTDPINDLVTAHNTDLCNVPWALGATSHLFTWVNVSYCI